MKISILCTDPNHPVVNSLRAWADIMSSEGDTATLVFDKAELPGGDILFLVSCSQIIRDAERRKYKATLVLHASDLPKRRGWSPHIWSILDGEDQIVVSLLEAKEPVDSGAIWLKTTFALEGHELLSEINAKLFDAELLLMTRAVQQFESIEPVQQKGDPGPYMAKRMPADSQLDPYKSIAEQFNLLRVVDSKRYPAFFDYQGKRYLIKIEKAENSNHEEGLGANRFADVLGVGNIEIRTANEADSPKLFEWRNHQTIREVSKSSALIAWPEHQSWFASVLADRNRILLIGYIKGEPIGVVRFDKRGEIARVSIYLVPEGGFKGQGRNLLLSAEQWLKSHRSDIRYIRAEVLGENEPSQRLFVNANYQIKELHYLKEL